MCEISDQLHYKSIGNLASGYTTSISPDGKIIIGNNHISNVFFTVKNEDAVQFNFKMQDTGNVTFSNDSNTIMYCYGLSEIRIKQLLSENHKKYLMT